MTVLSAPRRHHASIVPLFGYYLSAGMGGGFIVPPGILRRLPGRPGEEAEAAHEEAAIDSLTRGPRGLVGLRAPLSPVGP